MARLQFMEPGQHACKECGKPAIATYINFCLDHWPQGVAPEDAVPIMLSKYQIDNILSLLEATPGANTGDWWAEVQYLLINLGADSDKANVPTEELKRRLTS